MMNLVDQIVRYFAPTAALRRAQARQVLSFYEAATISKTRKARRESGSGDAAVMKAGASLREQARHLEQNLDLARGVLDVLVQNVVGPMGIQTEPQPRRADGSIHAEFARQILLLQRDWSRRPEVTWTRNWASTQRIMGRSWFRDGEVLAQRLIGPVAALDHGTRTPYSLELLEADFLPFDYTDESRGIRMGVQRNAWLRPVAYHVLKHHPGDRATFLTLEDVKSVPASRILHVKTADRINQVRGVSVFAAVLARLDDIKDYEESERVAAKVAASMAAYIIKGTPDMYQGSEIDTRDMRFRPGMIFDDLEPGEQVGTIDTNRPNAQLEAHRKGQLRAVASGTGTTYSSLAKDYGGTYSSQRQELVEGFGAYGVLAQEFIGQFVQPVYEDFIQAAILSGALRVPSEVDPQTVDDALFIAPQMPWIDPQKEADAMETLERNTFASGPEIIRKRGQNPHDVLEQEIAWREAKREAGVPVDPAKPTEKSDGSKTPEARFRA